MAKIPVYRTEAAPTTATGQRSWRTRWNSRPFVEEALAKGEVGATAVNMVTEFLVNRDKTAREAAANQALVAAEAGMQARLSELSRTSDPTSVFSDDLTNPNSWQGSLLDIRGTVRDQLDPGARRLFDLKIGALEARYTASMRTKIDDRINQQLVDGFELNTLAFEETYSDINNPDISTFLYDGAMTDLANQGAGLVAQGRLNADDVVKRLDEMQFNTAESATAYFINQAANPLQTAMMLQEGDEEDLQAIAAMPGGALVLHALSKVTDKADRLKIIDDAADQAFEAYDNRQKLLEDENARIKVKQTSRYNSLFGMDAAAAQVVFDELSRANFMSPQQRDVAEAYIRGSGVFAEFDDTATVARIEALIAKGELSTDTLVNGAGFLTQATFQKYMTAAGTRRSQFVTAAMKDAAISFRYEEERGADVEPYENAAMQAYYRAQGRIMDYERENPGVSGAQIRAEAQSIIREEKQGLVVVVQTEAIQLLRNLEKRTPGLVLSKTANGEYDYAAIPADLLAYLNENPSRRIESGLTELNYYLNMIRSLRGE